jgi:tight adherence protein B
MSPQNLLALLIAVSVFLLVGCAWAIVVVIVGTRRKKREQLIGERLGMGQGEQQGTRTLRLWHDGHEAFTAVAEGQRQTFSQRFAKNCTAAGWEAPPHTILLGVGGAMCGGLALCLLMTGSPLVSVGASLGVLMAFRIFLGLRINRRRNIFESQLIDALELAARSLRVGHPLPGAFRLASEEIAAPVGTLFGNIVQQQELGVPLDQAMAQAASAHDSDDLRLFATSVIIQIRSGGNLADMMERVVAVMRDRMRLSRRVRVLISQTQFSKQILLSLPIGMFVLLNLMNAEYMKPLYTETNGQRILMIAAAMLGLGAYVMNKVAVIRY